MRAALDHRIPVTRRLRTEHPNSPSNYLDPLTENCPQKRGNSNGRRSTHRLAGQRRQRRADHRHDFQRTPTNCLSCHAMNRTGFSGDSIGWEIMESWED